MICKKCNMETPEDSKFCIMCGNKISKKQIPALSSIGSAKEKKKIAIDFPDIAHFLLCATLMGITTFFGGLIIGLIAWIAGGLKGTLAQVTFTFSFVIFSEIYLFYSFFNDKFSSSYSEYEPRMIGKIRILLPLGLSIISALINYGVRRKTGYLASMELPIQDVIFNILVFFVVSYLLIFSLKFFSLYSRNKVVPIILAVMQCVCLSCVLQAITFTLLFTVFVVWLALKLGYRFMMIMEGYINIPGIGWIHPDDFYYWGYYYRDYYYSSMRHQAWVTRKRVYDFFYYFHVGDERYGYWK